MWCCWRSHGGATSYGSVYWMEHVAVVMHELVLLLQVRAGFAACARADSVARAAESPACARATTGVLETATGPGCHTCAPGRGRIVRASEGCSCVQRADCCVAACAGCSSAPGDCSGETQHSVDSHEKCMRGC